MKTQKFVIDALRASLFVAPEDYGLSFVELLELGKPRNLRQGELNDALTRSGTFTIIANNRYWLGIMMFSDLSTFYARCEDDPRDIDAFEFVYHTFSESDREYGRGESRIDRSALLVQAERNDLDVHAVKIAIAIYMQSNELRLEANDLLRSLWDRASRSPKEQRAYGRGSQIRPLTETTKQIDRVRDVISRRTDGRPASIEPIDAFREKLSELNATNLKNWWNQVGYEMKQADYQQHPTTKIVLAAALVEAALCAVMERVKVVGGTMPAELWDKDTRQWKLINLIKEAKRGSSPILDDELRERAIRLNDQRQRIHAGRFWPDKPRTFDLRPEEAREASETVDQLLRAVLDWLERNPAPK